jgi:hypothetical protein
MLRAQVGQYQRASRGVPQAPWRRASDESAREPQSASRRPGQEHALALEALQPVGKDVRGDAGQSCLKIVETARAVEQRLHDEQAPAVADAIKGGLERGGRCFFCHGAIVASPGLARFGRAL